ncbi:low temperature requirement protein A [Micromonospora sp. MS34]|uniref:low temperature requirement protein A n=1 Tax=Micromonospora sp. MS34 TaxID=3385971 RepID=UPI0039A1B6DF
MTRLELFYDLIFAFGFLNVTGLVARNLTVPELAAGAVVAALLWWCRNAFVALGNVVRAAAARLRPPGGRSCLSRTLVPSCGSCSSRILGCPSLRCRLPRQLPGSWLLSAFTTDVCHLPDTQVPSSSDRGRCTPPDFACHGSDAVDAQ